MAAVRAGQVEAGDHTSLLGFIFGYLANDSTSPLWYHSAKKKPQREAIKFLKVRETKQIAQVFLTENYQTKWYVPLNPRKVAANYVHLPLQDRAKFAQSRLSSTRAAADSDRPHT